MFSANAALAASFSFDDAFIANNDRSQVTTTTSLSVAGTTVKFVSDPGSATFGSSMTSNVLRGHLYCSACPVAGIPGYFRSRTPTGSSNIEAITFIVTQSDYTTSTTVTINGTPVQYIVTAIFNGASYGPNKTASYSANAGAVGAELDAAIEAFYPPQIKGPSGLAGDSTSAISVYENQTTVTTFTSNETTAWSISGGVDQSFFTINASTGIITFNAPPDYETPLDDGGNNTYIVEIMATDVDSNSSTQILTVTVLDLDEAAPTITAGQNFNYSENQSSGATVATISATDNVGVTGFRFAVTGPSIFIDRF